MMSNERYVRKEYAIWDTYLDREVQKLNHRYQCNHICEILNKKENIIQKLESENENLRKQMISLETTMDTTSDYNAYLQSEVKDLKKENEKLKNELKKEKLLLEYSDSMYGADLLVNVRFTNGEWKADVSVIDNE